MMSSRLRSSLLFTFSCVLVAAACGPRDRYAVRVIDLVRELDHAEARPAPGSFAVSEFVTAGVSRPSIVTTAPSRLVFVMPFPRRATFRTAVAIVPAAAASVRFRVGISDDRIYELLADATVPAGSSAWTEISADLSAYAGWKWSVFYRPDRRSWRLVLSTDVAAGVPVGAVWGVPGIDADADAAHAYAARPEAIRPRGH
jgi:hypothetical protein